MNDLSSGSLNYHFLKINIFSSSKYLFCTLNHDMSVFSLHALQLFEKHLVAFGLKAEILINNEIFEIYNKNSNFFFRRVIFFLNIIRPLYFHGWTKESSTTKVEHFH